MLSETPVTGGGWERVIGQQQVKAFLRNSIRRNRLAHAYLFSGPEGSGMDAMAFELSRVVLCPAKGDVGASATFLPRSHE